MIQENLFLEAEIKVGGSMVNFNELLVEYLRLFGEYVRGNGHELEFRGIQYYLENLADVVAKEDVEQLIVELEDLKEEAAEFV